MILWKLRIKESYFYYDYLSISIYEYEKHKFYVNLMNIKKFYDLFWIDNFQEKSHMMNNAWWNFLQIYQIENKKF